MKEAKWKVKFVYIKRLLSDHNKFKVSIIYTSFWSARLKSDYDNLPFLYISVLRTLGSFWSLACFVYIFLHLSWKLWYLPRRSRRRFTLFLLFVQDLHKQSCRRTSWFVKKSVFLNTNRPIHSSRYFLYQFFAMLRCVKSFIAD